MFPAPVGAPDRGILPLKDSVPENPDPALSVTREFLQRVTRSFAEGTFVGLTLSSPTDSAAGVERISGRLVEVRGRSVLSLTLQEARRDLVQNVPPEEAEAWLTARLGTTFRAALLGTTRRDWQLSLAAGRTPRLVPHPPRVREVPSRIHDRPTTSALAESANDWLARLEVLDESGRVRPSRADKLQQIRHYAEILGHLVDDAGWPAGAELRVADMGCGKGFLTFAAWQLLQRQRGFQGEVIGIEARPELAAGAESIARDLRLQGLRFVPGTIAETDPGPLDVLIALHACNTATDDALLRGIRAGVRVLLVAPCCHQQVRPQLGRPAPFENALEHGLLAERAAEWLTDALRLEFLGWAGYRTKALEFVASEHTPKNVLIAGVRTREPFQEPERRARIQAMKAFYGVTEFALDSLLGATP